MKAERETFTNGNNTIYLDTLPSGEKRIWLKIGVSCIEIHKEDIGQLAELLAALFEEMIGEWK